MPQSPRGARWRLLMYVLVLPGVFALFEFGSRWFGSRWFGVVAGAALAGLAVAIDYLPRRGWTDGERAAWMPVVPEGKKPQTFSSPGGWRFCLGMAILVGGLFLSYYGPAHVVWVVVVVAGFAIAVWGGVLMRRGV